MQVYLARMFIVSELHFLYNGIEERTLVSRQFIQSHNFIFRVKDIQENIKG